ncbi:MAG: anion permease, partial [Desulfosarcina sp.]|nr:anion permease [Desulfosarcina sp.]
MNRWGRIVCGPLLAIACFVFLPSSYNGPEGDLIALTNDGRATLAVMVWMAAWWLTEAIHISATALLPVVLFPVLGIRSIEQAASPYASPLIFLFMGGFLLALSMQRWRLDRRIALLTLKLVGTKPTHMVGGFMLVTAVLSAFLSNTATAAMMLPIALSVIGLVERQHPKNDADGSSFEEHFSLCLLISIAYAASIGGVATIIGTPPNALLVGFLKSSI